MRKPIEDKAGLTSAPKSEQKDPFLNFIQDETAVVKNMPGPLLLLWKTYLAAKEGQAKENAKENLRVGCKRLSQLQHHCVEQEKFDQAYQYALIVLLVYKKLFGEESSQYQFALGAMSVVLHKQGRYQQALICIDKAIAAAESARSMPNISTVLKKKYEEILAATLNDKANLLWSMGELSKARDEFVKAYQIQCVLYGDGSLESLGVLNNLAKLLAVLGQYDQSIKYFRQILPIQKNVLKSHPAIATTLDNLGIVLRDKGDYPAALNCHQEALAIREKFPDAPQGLVAWTYDNIGVVFCKQGKFPESLEWHNKGLSLQKRIDKKHSRCAEILTNIGNVHHEQAQYPQALTCYEQALEIQKQHYGEDSLPATETLTNMAHVHLQLEKYDLGIKLHNQVLQAQIKIYGEQHVKMAPLYLAHGNGFLLAGNYAKALDLFTKALSIFRENFSEPHEKIAEALVHLASYFVSTDQPQQALQTYYSALAMCKSVFPGGHPQLARAYNNMASVLIELGQYADAELHLKKSLVMDEELFGKQTPHKIGALSNQGNLFMLQAKYPEALNSFQEAFHIAKKTFGLNSAQVAKLYHEFAHLLAEHRMFNEALQHYEECRRLFASIYGEHDRHVAMVLGSMGIVYAGQGNFEQGIAYQQKVLACFPPHVDRPSEETAHAYNNMASLYALQNKLELALQNYQLAYEIHLKNLGREHYKTCQVKVHIAKTYREMSYQAEEKLAGRYLAAAAQVYEELLTINREILTKTTEAWKPYDLNGHHQTLSLLSQVYLRQGRIQEVASLYYTEATRHGISALLVFYYSKQALHYFKLLPKQEKPVAQLYQLIAASAFAQKRYNFALKTLGRLMLLDTNPQHEKRYVEWQNSAAKQRTTLGEDIATQLESCRDRYDHLRTQILEALTSENASDRVKNHCTELMITINNLLDISYGRFVRRAIHGPNKVEIPDLYFPLANSAAALTKELKQKQVVIDPLEFKDEIFSDFKKPQGISMVKTLVSKGYVNKSRRVLKKSLQDRELKDLDEHFDCLRKELADLLCETGEGKVVAKEKISTFNTCITTDPIYRPPVKEKIVQVLKDKKIITVVSSTVPLVCRLAQEVKWLPGMLVPDTKDAGEQRRFAGYEKQIIAKIQHSVVQKKSLKSLAHDFPQVLTKIAQQQPFHFFDEKQNAQVPGYWQQSWLAPVIAVSNSGKHISVAPHSLVNHLTEKCGTLRRHHLQFMVSYVETGLSPWSFISSIQAIQPMPDVEAIRHSSQLFQVLKTKKYIDRGRVIHPLALQILPILMQANLQQQREAQEKKFLEQLQNDLPDEYQLYARPLAALMLRRVMQYTHVELYFDQKMEMDFLIEKSLSATEDLACVLGAAYNPAGEAKFSKQELKKADRKTETTQATTKDLQQEMAAIVASTKPLEPQHLQKFHQHGETLARIYRQQEKIVDLGNHYLASAQEIEKHSVALAWHYHRKALHYLSVSLSQEDFLFKACMLQAEFYSRNDLWQLGSHTLKRYVKLLSSAKQALFNEKFTQHQKQFHDKFATYHPDIYSQWEHAKIGFLRVQYLLIKLASNQHEQSLIERIQSEATHVIVKLRHLLDQAFTRLIHYRIYFPNQTWVSIHVKNAIKFYSYKSEKELMTELRKKEILCEEKSLVSLERNFPEVFQCLMEAQSFASDSWLRELILLCNQLKHVGFEVFKQGGDAFTFLEKIMQLLVKSFLEAERIFAKIFKYIPLADQEKSALDQKQSSTRKIPLGPNFYRFFSITELPVMKAQMDGKAQDTPLYAV